MEEKLSESKGEEPVEEKKPYTPPALTVYGKLVDLTAGGSVNSPENKGHPEGNRS